MDTALAVLDEYERMGVREMWFTPHIMEDVPNTVDTLKDRHEGLMSAYRGKVIVCLASESIIDNLFHERLESGELLPIGYRNDMLQVETTTFNAPMDFKGTLRKIRKKGYYPLLDHHEQYSCLPTLKEYRRIKEIGVRFQLNLLSLAGAYGKKVQKKAMDFMRNGMYDCYESALHRIEQIDHLKHLTLTSIPLSSVRELNRFQIP